MAMSSTRFSIRAGVGIDERATGALHRVGEHQDARFARLRFGARIAITALFHALLVRIVLGLPGGLTVEVLDQRRAMVLFNEIDNRLRQAVLSCQVGTVLDVGDDHQRAHGRQQRLVAIRVTPLVLDEVARLEHLANVVEVGSHSNQQTVGTDRFGGRLRPATRH